MLLPWAKGDVGGSHGLETGRPCAVWQWWNLGFDTREPLALFWRPWSLWLEGTVLGHSNLNDCRLGSVDLCSARPRQPVKSDVARIWNTEPAY